jgi:outer membrane protein TolC
VVQVVGHPHQNFDCGGFLMMSIDCISTIKRLRLQTAGILLLAGVTVTAAANAQQAAPVARVDLEQAIQLAIAHNHALKAAANQIQQSQAEEITAGLRPNPVLT